MEFMVEFCCVDYCPILNREMAPKAIVDLLGASKQIPG